MEILVINLARAADRWSYMSSQLDALGVTYRRVDAVDGRSLPAAELTCFAEARPRDGARGWMPGQIGCFMSHFSAWESIANGSAPAGLVLEDDLRISGVLADFMTGSDWMPPSADIVRIESTGQWQKIGEKRQAFGRTVGQTLSTAWCAGAYFVTRAAAAKLVASAPELHAPTDFFLFDHRNAMARALCVWQVYPALCIQDKMDATSHLGFASDIETSVINGRNLATSIRRELTSRLAGKTKISFR